jgi:hypothetical protein
MHNANMCIKQYFLKEQNVTFLKRGALYEHHTNLIEQTLFKMGIMGKIENVLQGFYDYFFIILKEHKSLLILLTWWKQWVLIFYEYKNKVDFDGTPN